eukprot:TRINITY_DN19802_c0_g1_i1.p1 TRINITY_DN19802_c0_g1~~TRINITY_DN19802_c0_g1_i1.p1  ORF type:complete len:172 (-),score=33.88 TRINITY_DN19802_c0_g1_i1:5-520(-)
MFFFFKQKTAYEMQRGLVGSEMCIRDSPKNNMKKFHSCTCLIQEQVEELGVCGKKQKATRTILKTFHRQKSAGCGDVMTHLKLERVSFPVLLDSVRQEIKEALIWVKKHGDYDQDFYKKIADLSELSSKTIYLPNNTGNLKTRIVNFLDKKIAMLEQYQQTSSYPSPCTLR